MVDSDILARRLLTLNEALGHLDAAGVRDSGRLAGEPMLRAAVERWLQIAIEACIDIAYHIVAAEGWTSPDTARAAFMVLADHGLLDAELATRLGHAVGMRNVLVHDYVAVDLDLLARAVREDLSDLRRFGSVAGRLVEE